MNEILMYVMAFGALLGGVDQICGNRLGFGRRFEEAFRLLGPIALSMAGIICLAPLLSGVLGYVIVPVFDALKLDPGMFGSILAIDMGGYQMAMDLCRDGEMGRFSGIIVSAIFGCTVVFTIPVGLGTMEAADRHWFIRGILMGLGSIPLGLMIGGVAMGLPLGQLLWNCLPIFAVCGLLFWGLVKAADRMLTLFQRFAKGIQALATLGLTAGAIAYMTGWQIPRMIPLEEAMEVVCSIAIVMLGSMPLAELIQRVLKTPFAWIGARTGLNSTSTTGILIGMVSVMPALAMIPRMDKRGKMVNGAFVVCGASAFTAHLGFCLSTQPDLAGALLASKLLGGLGAVILALTLTRDLRGQ